MKIKLIFMTIMLTILFPLYANGQVESKQKNEDLFRLKSAHDELFDFKNAERLKTTRMFTVPKTIERESSIEHIYNKFKEGEITDQVTSFLTSRLDPKHQETIKTIVKYIEVDIGSECYIGVKVNF